jgi:hypothetical protein
VDNNFLLWRPLLGPHTLMKYAQVHIFSAHVQSGSSYAAFTPSLAQSAASDTPQGSLLAVASRAREALGGKVASSLALEHFVNGAIEAWRGNNALVDSIESGIQASNRAVFEFGARLGSGGRLAASLLVLGASADVVAIARAGKGEVLILRDGVLIPLFEVDHLTQSADPTEGVFVGASPKIQVEIITVTIKEGEILLVCPSLPEKGLLERLAPALVSSLTSGTEATFAHRAGMDSFCIGLTLNPSVILLERTMEIR